jgi:hypothetical protein
MEFGVSIAHKSNAVAGSISYHQCDRSNLGRLPR